VGYQARLRTPRTQGSITRKRVEAAIAYHVVLELPDGSTQSFAVRHDEHVLAAARRVGIQLPSLCEQGWDLACAVQVISGDVDQTDAQRYYEADRSAGFALICTAKPQSDLRLRTHQAAAMRKHRDDRGLPAPRGT
jgi:ferredoxin